MLCSAAGIGIPISVFVRQRLHIWFNFSLIFIWINFVFGQVNSAYQNIAKHGMLVTELSKKALCEGRNLDGWEDTHI